MRHLAINHGRTVVMTRPEFLRWAANKQLWSIGWYDAHRYDSRAKYLPHDVIAICKRHKLGMRRGRPYYSRSYHHYTEKGTHVFDLLHWKVRRTDNGGLYYVTRADRRSRH